MRVNTWISRRLQFDCLLFNDTRDPQINLVFRDYDILRAYRAFYAGSFLAECLCCNGEKVF